MAKSGPGRLVDLRGREKRVAERVTAHREEVLRVSRAEMARRSGVSYRMLQDLENGNRSRYTALSVGKVEDQYGWTRGSIEAIAAGGDPTPAAAPEQNAAPGPGPDTESDSVEILGRRRFTTEVQTGRGRRLRIIVTDLDADEDDDEADEELARVLSDTEIAVQVAVERERRRLREQRLNERGE